MRAVGDDELALRVRATARPQVRDLVRERVAQKHILPLLTLTRDAARQDDWLTATLSVVGVPPDATPSELLDQQRAVMAKNLDGFELVSGPAPVTVDGVVGAELGGRYRVRRGAKDEQVASLVRVFARGGLEVLFTSVWSARADGEPARAVAQGLHFF
jgi:hypothetical protein